MVASNKTIDLLVSILRRHVHPIMMRSLLQELSHVEGSKSVTGTIKGVIAKIEEQHHVVCSDKTD